MYYKRVLSIGCGLKTNWHVLSSSSLLIGGGGGKYMHMTSSTNPIMSSACMLLTLHSTNTVWFHECGVIKESKWLPKT